MSLFVPDFTQKLSWAEHHLEAFEREVKEFANRHPYEARRDHPDGQALTWSLVFTEQPQRTWSLQVGDVIQNMRASLDYLATALAAAKPSDRIYFPLVSVPVWDISQSPEESIAVARARQRWRESTRRMRPQAVEILKTLQPIGPQWETDAFHPYQLLVDLSNVDRHRELHLMVRGLTGISSTVTMLDSRVVPNPVEPDAPPGKEDGAALSDGANIVLPFGVEPEAVRSMSIRGDVTLAIQVDEERLTVVPEKLRVILNAIRSEVIEPLAPHIPS